MAHQPRADALRDDPRGPPYFAHPYSSWERGLNENTNALIRQCFPKDRDFTTLTLEVFMEFQDKFDTRPKKCIDYLTPHDIFMLLPRLH